MSFKAESSRDEREWAPPMHGTAWFTTRLIEPDDPTSFEAAVSKPTSSRTMFDRRENGWVEHCPHLFDVKIGTSSIECQVNPDDFDAEGALAVAVEFSSVIGKLPSFLLVDCDTIWIHRGNEGFGGGNRNLLIHTDKAREYQRDGVLEEVLIHEATHTSMDAAHAQSPCYLAARNSDPGPLSEYARDYPDREDLAEHMAPYLALRYRPERHTSEQLAMVSASIPGRIAYLDTLNLSMEPL